VARLSSRVLIALAYSACLFPLAADASDPPDYKIGDEIPLADSDLRAITLQVLESNPLVASSPGVKFAEAWRDGVSMPSGRLIDSAMIIYLPHVESGGIKQAFQVHCAREVPSEVWSCGDVEIRRYVQLDSQDFEVRVKGSLRNEEVLALIQATRATVQASTTDGSAVSYTAIIVFPRNDGYVVSWGSPEGRGGLTVEAHLRADGNGATPEDWLTSILPRQQ